MADNITLHTFDEVAEYFKNTPYGPKNKNNVLVTHDNRVFIRTMIAMPGVNRHGWGLEDEYIPYNVGTIKGTPLTFALQKDRTNSAGAGPQITFPHPTINNAPYRVNEGFQDAYIIGKYLGHEDKPDANRVWHGIAEVTNDKAKEFYGNLYLTEQEGTFPTTVSPQVLHYDNENPRAIKRWWFQHVTITDDPAYPPEYARISSACIGTEEKCIPEIKKAGPDIELNEHQAPVYHVVDASTCPICVKDALVELSKSIPENSSLIAKSASFDKIMNNESNSGNTQTAGLEANQTGGTNTQQQTGALSTAQTVNEQKPTNILPPVDKPEGYSAELEVKNLPQVIEKIIQEQMAKYLNENKPLNVPETPKKSKKAESEEGGEDKPKEEEKKEGDTPLTAREKALLERVTKSESEVAKLAEQERKRGIELVLASVNDGKQFIDGKTKKFDDKKFQSQVDYWMKSKLQPEQVEEQIKTMIDLVGGLSESKEEKKDEPQPNRAYASMAENKAAIYGVGDLNANNNTNQENVETKNASMSGGIMIKAPYFIELERRTVLRSDPIGQVE